MEQNVHEVEQIAPDTYRICESGWINSYLLLGEEKALLIDTGNGQGRLGETVAEITDLPVTVALTHGHCDHAGGVGWFGGCFLHKNDKTLSNKIASSRFVSKCLAKGYTDNTTFPRQPKKRKWTALEPGQTFELGGRSVGYAECRGHTTGSVAYLDDKHGLMFTGDNVCPALWLWLPGSTTVEEWLDGARLLRQLSESYVPWSGHGDGRQSAESISSLVEIGERLVAESRRNAFFSRVREYPNPDEQYKIRYKTGRVRSGKR